MNRGLAAMAIAAAVAGLGADPASASHETNELEITVSLNAAGPDRITVRSTAPHGLSTEPTSEVALALDRPPGSFRTSQHPGGGVVHPDSKLARPDRRGGFSYRLDTGKLQLLAQRQGYDAVIFVVCTPRVRQVVDSLIAPQQAPTAQPGSRCRGWYQSVEDPALRAVVQMRPDRQRYPSAVQRVAGAAAISFGLLGIGATLLRRGPLKHRSLGSWLVSICVAVGLAPWAWAGVTLAIWVSGSAADPVLLGGGSVGDQVARTLLPGLVFVLPALLPAAVLLSARRRSGPPSPSPAPPHAPVAPMWWPLAAWQQWGSQVRHD